MSNTSNPRFGFDAYFSSPEIQNEGVALPLRDAINFTASVSVPTDDEANDRTNVPLGSGGTGGGGGVTGGYFDGTGNLGDVDVPNDGTIHTSGSFATMLGVTAPSAGESKEFTLVVGTAGLTEIFDNAGIVAANGLSLPTSEVDLSAGSIVRFGYNHTTSRFVPLFWNDVAAGAMGPLPVNSFYFRKSDGTTGGSAHFTSSGGYPRVAADRTGGAADTTDIGLGFGGTIGVRSTNTYAGVRVDWLAVKFDTYNAGAKERMTFGASEDGSTYIQSIEGHSLERMRLTAGVAPTGDFFPSGFGLSAPGDASFGDTLFAYAWANFVLAGSLPTIEAFSTDPVGGGKGYFWIGDVFLARTAGVGANGFAIWSPSDTHHPTATIGSTDYDLLGSRRGAKIDMLGVNQDVSTGAKGAFVSNVRCIKIESSVTLTGDISLTLPGPSGTGTDAASGIPTFECLTWLVRCDFSDASHKVTLQNGNGGNVVTIGPVTAGLGTSKRFAIISSDADGVWMHGWSDENVSGYHVISGVTGS